MSQQSSTEPSEFDFSKLLEKLKCANKLEGITGPNGAVQELLKLTFNSVIKGEQEDHLGYTHPRSAS